MTFKVQRTHACDACGTTVIDRDEVLCAVCKPAPKFTVSTWFERDRAHVCLSDANDVTVAEWWDEACLEMFEDGFFQGGRALESSVIDYARDMGLIPRNATIKTK
jgi:hypothetical protein